MPFATLLVSLVHINPLNASIQAYTNRSHIITASMADDILFHILNISTMYMHIDMYINV